SLVAGFLKVAAVQIALDHHIRKRSRSVTQRLDDRHVVAVIMCVFSANDLSRWRCSQHLVEIAAEDHARGAGSKARLDPAIDRFRTGLRCGVPFSGGCFGWLYR